MNRTLEAWTVEYNQCQFGYCWLMEIFFEAVSEENGGLARPPLESVKIGQARLHFQYDFHLMRPFEIVSWVLIGNTIRSCLFVWCLILAMCPVQLFLSCDTRMDKGVMSEEMLCLKRKMSARVSNSKMRGVSARRNCRKRWLDMIHDVSIFSFGCILLVVTRRGRLRDT